MIVEGIVEMGKQLGRTLGFPTANIRPERTVGDYPANGVYVAALWMQGDNRAYPCMLNQGVHPTVPEGKPTIEAHLLNFDGDLYGQRLRVIYLHFLRKECRFDNLEALCAQLRRDLESTRQWILLSIEGSFKMNHGAGIKLATKLVTCPKTKPSRICFYTGGAGRCFFALRRTGE